MRAADPPGLPPGDAPRYQRVADAIAADIAAGRYEIGGLLPPEPELCSRYAVSRHTVREATRRLVASGLISRHPGIGTRIRARSVDSRYAASIGSLDELMQYSVETRLELLATGEVAATGTLASDLDCEPGTRWVELRTRRFADGIDDPISITDIYVPPAYRGIEHFFGKGRIAVYRLIERQFGERIVEVRQEVGGCAIGRKEAALLRVRSGSPGLAVRRTYLGAHERIVSISKNVYPANRFRFSTCWQLDEP